VKIGYGDGLIVRPWFEYALNGELIGKPSARFCALFFNGLPVNQGVAGFDIISAIRRVVARKDCSPYSWTLRHFPDRSSERGWIHAQWVCWPEFVNRDL